MDAYIDVLAKAFTDVMAKSAVVAGHYVKACGRQTLTGQDIARAIRFTVINIDAFPDIPPVDSDSDSDSDIEVVDEEDDPFTVYEGDDPIARAVNDATERWDEWEPESPLQDYLKKAVDSTHAA